MEGYFFEILSALALGIQN